MSVFQGLLQNLGKRITRQKSYKAKDITWLKTACAHDKDLLNSAFLQILLSSGISGFPMYTQS